MRNREKTKMELISRLLKRQIANFYSSQLGGKFPPLPKATLPVLLGLFLHFLLVKIPQNGVKKIVKTHQ